MSAGVTPSPSEPGSKHNQKGFAPGDLGCASARWGRAGDGPDHGRISSNADGNPDKRMSGAGDRLAISLAVGDCFNSSQHGEVYTAAPVPCSQPRDGEVFATLLRTHRVHRRRRRPRGERSLPPVRDRLTDYVMDDWSLPHTTGVNYYYPTP